MLNTLEKTERRKKRKEKRNRNKLKSFGICLHFNHCLVREKTSRTIPNAIKTIFKKKKTNLQCVFYTPVNQWHVFHVHRFTNNCTVESVQKEKKILKL